MRKRQQVAKDLDVVIKAMAETKDVAEFKKLQAVYLADTMPDMNAEEIAKITMLKEYRVKMIHANFRKNGVDSVKDKRGGRYREYMTIAEEADFLAPFEQKSKSGTIAVAGEIKAAYEKKIGKKVAESTIYRLLDRHGFRKIVPYKRHKKADVEAQEAFKKTSFP